MRDRFAQTVLTFIITYVIWSGCKNIFFVIGFFSPHTMEKLSNRSCIFLRWGLVLINWSIEFSEQTVVRTCSRTPFAWGKKNGFWCAMSARGGLFNNFRTRAPDSKQQRLPRVYWVHSVRRATFSASAVALVIFSFFSEFLLLLIKRYSLYKVPVCSTTFFQLTLFYATFFQSRTFVLLTRLGRPRIICPAFPRLAF